MRSHRASRTAVKVGRFMAALSRQPRLAPLVPAGLPEVPVSQFECPVVADRE